MPQVSECSKICGVRIPSGPSGQLPLCPREALTWSITCKIIIKDLENGKAPAEKTIIMDEKGFDASTITQEDVDNYGI